MLRLAAQSVHRASMRLLTEANSVCPVMMTPDCDVMMALLDCLPVFTAWLYLQAVMCEPFPVGQVIASVDWFSRHLCALSTAIRAATMSFAEPANLVSMIGRETVFLAQSQILQSFLAFSLRAGPL